MEIDPFIEAQYVFWDRSPVRTTVYAEIAESSARERACSPTLLDQPYGDHVRECVDLFPGQDKRPLLVFLHGGYWRSHHKDRYAFVANALRQSGFSIAVVGYPLAPERPLAAIVQSLGRAMHWLHNAGSRLLPAWRGTIVAGHSAGGHLAAMLASDAVLGPRIAGCLALSGVFDLEPLSRTSIGMEIGLDPEMATRLSPLARPAGTGWLIAAVGANETRAFQDQASRYVAHWASANGAAEQIVVPAADHYSILRQLADLRSPVLQRLLARADTLEVAL